MALSTPPRITCVVVDDEPLAQHILIDFIEKRSILQLIGAATNVQEALPLIEQLKPDLLFLDIRMTRKSGFELLQSLAVTPTPLVVITSAYSEYALQGYDFSVVDFLEKPIAFTRFEEAVRRVQERLGARYLLVDVPSTDEKTLSWTTDSITVKVNSDIVIIPHLHICYVEALENYVKIIDHNGKSVLTKLTLLRIQEILPGMDFLRISRSHIIRLSDIQQIIGNFSRVELTGGILLPIGVTYRHLVKDKIASLQSSRFPT